MTKGARRGRAAGDAAVPPPIDFEELDAAGWIGVPGVLPGDEAARLARRCDELVENIAAEPRVGDKKTGMHRLVDVLERVPEVSSIFQNPALVAAVEWFLRDRGRLSEVTFRSPGPGSGEQKLHTDDVPLEAGEPWRVVTAIIALCDFTEDNGATGIVPGSHRRPDLQRQAGKLDFHRDEIVVTGRAGTAGWHEAASRPRDRWPLAAPGTRWHYRIVDEEAVPAAELFLDDRGSLLRVRWDEHSQQLVLSQWREGVCVATHRLDTEETARLSSLLTHAWAEGLQRSLAESE